MYKIGKIYGQNFLSYPEISLDFGDKSIIVIQAEGSSDGSTEKSNGFGKSTIAELISYAIYGKLLRTQGSRVSVNDLIREGAEELTASVELHRVSPSPSGKGNSIVLKRTLDVNGSKTISMTVDGAKRKFDKKSDINRSVEEWIGLDFDMLMRRLLTPENTSFISLYPSERLKVVSSLATFNWDKVWVDMINRCKALSLEIEGLKKEISNLKIQEAQLEGQKDLLSYKNNIRDEQTNELRSKLKELQTKQICVQKQFEAVEVEYSEMKPKVKAKDTETSKAKAVMMAIREKIKGVQSLDPKKDLASQFEKVGVITCPSCNSEIPPDDLIDHLAHIRQKEAEETVDTLKAALDLAVENYTRLNDELRTVSTSFDELNTKRNILEADTRVKSSEKARIVKELQKLEKEAKASETLKDADVIKKLDELKKRMGKIDKEIAKKESLYASCTIVKNASQTTSPARLASIARLLPGMAKGTSKVVSHLFGKPIEVGFNIDDKQLEIIAPQLHIPTMSTGERRSFDIAFAYTIQDMALQSSRNQIGFFIGDELFDGLDTERTQLALNLIKSLPVPQIIVITHSDTARAMIEMVPDISIIRVTNDNGVSRARFIELSEVLNAQKEAP